MVIASVLIFQLMEGLSRRKRLLATISIAGSTTVASAVLSGQLTPLILLVGLSALLAYQRRRLLEAGLILGLLCIKPHFAIAAVLLLLVARQGKVVAGMLATGAACALVSVLIVGPDGVADYVSLMQRSFERPASLYINVYSEQNLTGFAATVFGVHGGPLLAAAGTIVAVAMFIIVARAVRTAPYEGIERTHYVAALLAALIVSVAPHIQYYDLALLAFGAMFIIRRAELAPEDARARFYGLLVLLVLWLEVAGVLAGAALSISFVPLVLFTVTLAAWPRVEAWLTSPESLPATRIENPAEAPRLAA
jgi:hypothetical protein